MKSQPKLKESIYIKTFLRLLLLLIYTCATWFLRLSPGNLLLLLLPLSLHFALCFPFIPTDYFSFLRTKTPIFPFKCQSSLRTWVVGTKCYHSIESFFKGDRSIWFSKKEGQSSYSNALTFSKVFVCSADCYWVGPMTITTTWEINK